MSTSLAAMLAACGSSQSNQTAQTESTAEASGAGASRRETISNDVDGEHAIAVSGEQKSYTAVDVTKTGEADGDEADFYGENSAIFATEKATLTLDDITVTTNGTHANAIFSYGEQTSVSVANSTIETSGNCSGGLMVTGGGKLEAHDITVHTTGNSSAAIRSDRGGGTQTVVGGSYATEGTGSPAIYSTADVTVSGAKLTSTASQGVVVEGKNSVTLNDCEVHADNNKKNSDKSDWFQAVMIYQSMSGDAAQGEASFSMTGGSLENAQGDLFFVNNTVATISLQKAKLTNGDASGNILRAAAAGWGSEGSNGGHVTLRAIGQELVGTMLVDEVSSLNLYLSDGSSLVGSVNPDASAGEVYVEISDGCTWELTADAHIASLTCGADAISLKGHTLTVGDASYQEGTASTGEAIEVEVSSSGNPDGKPGEGKHGDGMPGDGSEPPAKPEGKPGDGSNPPAKPDGQPGDGTEPPSQSSQSKS